VPEQQTLQFKLRHQKTKQKKQNKKSCTLSTFLLPHFILTLFSYSLPHFFPYISNIASIIFVSITGKTNTGPLGTTAFLFHHYRTSKVEIDAT